MALAVLLIVGVVVVTVVWESLARADQRAEELRAVAQHRGVLASLGDAVAGVQGTRRPQPHMRRPSPPLAKGPAVGPPTRSADPARRPTVPAPCPARHRARTVARWVAVSLGIAASAALVFGYDTPFGRVLPESRATPPSTAPPGPGGQPAAAVPRAAPAPVEPVSVGRDRVVFATKASVTLVLVARGRCRVSVQDPLGREVFAGVLGTGDRREITSPTPLEVRLRRPARVDVYLDAAPVQVPQRDRALELAFVPR